MPEFKDVCYTYGISNHLFLLRNSIMSTVLMSISETEYLRRERAAEFKSGHLNGEMFAMAVGSPNHSLIAANFVGSVWLSLQNKPCKVFNSDLRIMVRPTGLFTYPDASIVCGDLEFSDDVKDSVTNPTVIVEVLSESTEKYDRGAKAEHYRQLASVQELVLVSQDKYHVEQYLRQPDGSWRFEEHRSLQSTLALTSIGIAISLEELYRGVIDFVLT